MTASCQAGFSGPTARAATLGGMLWFMPILRACRPVFSAGLGLAMAATGALAQDPPARVGHASVLAGAVQHSTDGQAWGPAAVGWPLTTGSALRTPAQARAEVRIGSTALRLSAQGELHLDRLDDEVMALRLASGRLTLRQRRWGGPGDRLSVDLNGPRFDATSAGSFHLDVDPNSARVAARVFEGSGTLTLGAQRLAIASGQQVVADRRSATVLQQGPAERSAIDDWSDRRELRSGLQGEAAQRHGSGSADDHTPPEMTGTELLDAHGSWRVAPRLGAVWFPRSVPPDWAPYRHGRWAWLAPWGWTWVDDAPWGFAPFHYGRWAFLAGRWGWLPGDARARPVFAPALVGFYGTPSGGWASGSPAAVGWYPLGPGEAYQPGYPASSAHVLALNAPHGAQPAAGGGGSGHRLAQTSFAATVVPQAAFASGQALATARLDVAPGTLAGAPVLGSAGLPAAPAALGRPAAFTAAPGPATASAPTTHANPRATLRERLQEARQARQARRAERLGADGARQPSSP